MVVHQDGVIEMVAAPQGVDHVTGGKGQHEKAHLLVELSDERRNSLLDAEFRSGSPVQVVATVSRAQEKTLRRPVDVHVGRVLQLTEVVRGSCEGRLYSVVAQSEGRHQNEQVLQLWHGREMARESSENVLVIHHTGGETQRRSTPNRAENQPSKSVPS